MAARGYTAEYADGRPADGPKTAIGAVYRAFTALDTARAQAEEMCRACKDPIGDLRRGSRLVLPMADVLETLIAEDWRALGLAVMADLAEASWMCLPGPGAWRKGGRAWPSR